MKYIIVVCIGLLSACAHFDRYQWATSDKFPVCKEVPIWKQVPNIRGLCSTQGKASHHAACVLGECLIVSIYSEQEARLLPLDGMTLYTHEIKHTKGWIHQ